MPTRGRLELWGGIECTIARIGDDLRDQVAETGHHDRPDDLDRVAALGIRMLRHPILWEALAGQGPSPRGWAWHDARLRRLADLGIGVIAGLVHHGSGPRGTHLLDPRWPGLLARHAERVARRYPWLDSYTPVNEPLTTARFSALYGHWYPHRRDYAAFLPALVNQCWATILAMRAIRRVNPAARLVATDDLGRVFATPALAGQAAHENERRWLGFDLLFGRVDRHHPWWRVFRDHGVSERRLGGFLDGEGRPDIVGINHYLTSDRFLDERLDRYPAHLAGGNGREAYADVEAVRVLPSGRGRTGPAARLREVWARYGTPVAITEVHHGCTRDEQLRWFADVWRAAAAVRREGADVRAVTLWALFGARDWNSLLTRRDGIYEPGAFDVRGPAPRPTALAAAARGLARRGRFDHPVLDVPGWWRRQDRFYEPDSRAAPALARPGTPRSLLLLGGSPSTRDAFIQAASTRGFSLRTAVPGPGPVGHLAEAGIWGVLDLGGPSGPRWAEACAAEGLAYASISDADAFGHDDGTPRRETDPPRPGPVAEREARLRSALPRALMVRTGPLFGPWQPDGLVAPLLGDLATGRPVAASSGLVAPTYLPDLAHVVLDLVIDGADGVWHLTSPAPLAWTEFVRQLAGRIGAEPVFAPGRGAACPAALDTGRGELMPRLDGALDRFLAQCRFAWRRPADALAAAE